MEFLPAVRSIPDIFEKLYGKNKFLALLAALMTIVIPIGATCSQLLAFAKIYTAITGLPVSVLVIIFAIVAFLLVLPGGLKSVAWTDAIMGCLMLVFSFLTAFYALHTAGGWNAVVAAMPADKIAFPSGMAGVICGFIGCGIAQYAGATIPFAIYGLIASLAGMIIASKLTAKKAA